MAELYRGQPRVDVPHIHARRRRLGAWNERHAGHPAGHGPQCAVRLEVRDDRHRITTTLQHFDGRDADLLRSGVIDGYFLLSDHVEGRRTRTRGIRDDGGILRVRPALGHRDYLQVLQLALELIDARCYLSELPGVLVEQILHGRQLLRDGVALLVRQIREQVQHEATLGHLHSSLAVIACKALRE